MKTPVIGVVDAPRKDRYLSVTPFGASLRARGSGYDTFLVHALKHLPTDLISGIVHNNPQNIKDDRSLLASANEQGLNTINLIDQYKGISSNVIDFTNGMHQAVGHLKELGHTHISFINAISAVPAARHRRTAFKQALETHGIEYDPSMDLQGNWDSQSGDAQMRNLLGSNSNCTAVICYNDQMAIGCIHAAKRYGLKVPEDLAVIGCGNSSQVINSSDHPLSSISYPIYSAAYEATDYLISAIENKERKPFHHTVTSHFCPRQSTKGNQYVKPTLELEFSKHGFLLEYLISLGGSVSANSRQKLITEFEKKAEGSNNAFIPFQKLMLESIKYGLDSIAAHHFLLSIGNEWSSWSRDCTSSMSIAQILETLFSEVSLNGMFLNRFTEHLFSELQNVFHEMRERLTRNADRETLSLELQRLSVFLKMRCFTVALLDHPCQTFAELSGEATYLKFTADHEPVESRIFATAESVMDDLFGGKRFPMAIETIPLESPDGVLGFVFLDLDSPYSLFNLNIVAEIQVALMLSMDCNSSLQSSQVYTRSN